VITVFGRQGDTLWVDVDMAGAAKRPDGLFALNQHGGPQPPTRRFFGEKARRIIVGTSRRMLDEVLDEVLKLAASSNLSKKEVAQYEALAYLQACYYEEVGLDEEASAWRDLAHAIKP
jgi:hypothetical protein